MLYKINFYCYAHFINEYCDNLFMIIACVEWLNWSNDDMYVFNGSNWEFMNRNELVRLLEYLNMNMYCNNL
jgi:hypothetical protein